MDSTTEAILGAALKLPEEERLLSASRLLETVPDEPCGLSLDDPDLLEELKQRSTDQEGTLPWSQARGDL